MKLLALSLTLVLPPFAFAEESGQTVPPRKNCPLCELPNRAALLAGVAKCPADCEKLCCTGTEANYVVSDMTEARSENVAAALAKLPAVQVKAVCHQSGRAVVKYDPRKIKGAELIAAVNATGCKVAGEKVSYQVTSMTSEEGAAEVEKALSLTEGITKIEIVVRPTGSQVEVVFDPAKTSKPKVAAAINTTKFKVAG